MHAEVIRVHSNTVCSVRRAAVTHAIQCNAMRACARTTTALGAAKTGLLMMSLGRAAEAGLRGLGDGAGAGAAPNLSGYSKKSKGRDREKQSTKQDPLL